MDKIAVVILNWNGVKLLEQFLPSVIQFSEGAAIYVADNDSTDNSVEFVTLLGSQLWEYIQANPTISYSYTFRQGL